MAIIAKPLAAGAGWHVRSLTCSFGPQDRPVDEQHASICIAVVTRGSFKYRTSQGSAVLVPGALLLGNEGSCFQCGHEHSVGDHCLSFHYDTNYFEEILRAVDGARPIAFAKPRLPPTSALAPYVAAAESAVTNPAALEEIALELAGVVAATLADAKGARSGASSRDERRVADVIRILETRVNEPLALADLATEAAMSPYHFLRVFREVTGATPHQFILATRLRLAAVRLQQTDEAVSAIAYDVGFNDLSEFNRRFRRFMGVAPLLYRSRGPLNARTSVRGPKSDLRTRRNCETDPKSG
jgi:AraC family transcriptional regulator